MLTYFVDSWLFQQWQHCGQVVGCVLLPVLGSPSPAHTPSSASQPHPSPAVNEGVQLRLTIDLSDPAAKKNFHHENLKFVSVISLFLDNCLFFTVKLGFHDPLQCTKYAICEVYSIAPLLSLCLGSCTICIPCHAFAAYFLVFSTRLCDFLWHRSHQLLRKSTQRTCTVYNKMNRRQMLCLIFFTS